jgi:uncharacterized phage protein gp47/JayE
MSLKYPTFSGLVGQIRAVLRVQLPSVDPTIFGSWARGFVDGCAVLAQSILLVVRDLEKQLFPQTATGSFLDLWGGYEGLERNPESAATGSISLDDTTVPVGTTIPALTDFTGSNGIIYQSTAVSTIVATNQSIVLLGRVGPSVFAVMASEHPLATGMKVNVSGADQPEYNGEHTIVVTQRGAFSYTIAGTPVTPATGTPVYDLNMASIPVEAQETGTTTNLSNGAQLTNETYGTALVQFDGLTGGASEELDEPYRARILLSRSNVSGVFTDDQVKLAALSITGNTRAFVKRAVYAAGGGFLDPEPGQVSVFFLRDNDANIVPSASVIATTKQAIIDEGKMPANTAEADVFVQGPTLVPTAFDFTALSPDTPTMRTAVGNNLTAFFKDTVDFEETVTEASYLGAIQNTQDLETGAFITSFALSTPTGDIVITDGEIASLGAVTFSI